MVDFLLIATRSTKNGVIEIYPKFNLIKNSDLMIRGGDFYAVWLEDEGLWSTDEHDVIRIVDNELDLYLEKNKDRFGSNARVLHMWDAETRMIDSWHHYCQKQMRDSFHMLDERIIFSNVDTKKEDYASKKLPYPLEEGETPGYDKLMSTLYSDEERHKLEWAIGSIVNGDSKKLQKFIVLYGSSGTGKSTVLNLIQKLFDGYFCVFDAKALGSANNSFALEAFRTNPLVAIQHDGDLSRIEDNTRLNSLVSHEVMIVNEKFRSTYSNSFKCFLFMGTNKPVKITDAKSGLIRRLIDVAPTGDTLSLADYNLCVRQMDFELGAIASRCLKVYEDNPNYYDEYIPVNMLGASNDFYNFVVDSYYIFKEEDNITLKAAWEMYKTYCEDARINYPFNQRIFKEELKNYFDDYKERCTLDDGTRVRNYFIGFKTDKFESTVTDISEPESDLIQFKKMPSAFDKEYAGCLAQYASAKDIPCQKWDEVETKLSELDTSRTHYVKLPDEHNICVDFDFDTLEENIKEASKWPPTYAELSKSGKGVHLHYIYTGDADKLSRVYAEHIEVKVFTGNSSLRRKLTKCNNLSIATISSGLPLREEKKVVNFDTVKNEKAIRTLIERNLNKEYHASTKCSVDFIDKILEEAHESGMTYDVTDLRPDILKFASNSTNNARYCIDLVNKMPFASDNIPENEEEEAPIIFYDVEVFPNLFLVCWKAQGEEKEIVHLINPSSTDISKLLEFRLIGFNCRKYDNHLLYACLLGYSNEAIYKVSQNIVTKKSKDAFFREAYNLSYADIFDFSSKKQSLKKFEIELGIHHQELGLPWDQPVPKELWPKVIEYCENDVRATEAIFNTKERQEDFTARKVLADVAGMTVNDTTNTLTTRIIFGEDRHPQDEFNYRFMGKNAEGTNSKNNTQSVIAPGRYNIFDELGRPIFPGYLFENGVSTYRGDVVGEGGCVYAEPGMYGNVALCDIQSQHPTSIITENLFGDRYTKRFKDILDARLAIKHGDFNKAKKMLNGALERYLTNETAASDLAQALKIAINSVYGLTAAKFDNPFSDIRNKDNIVAKRGALFMINLRHEVQKRGFTVAHIKTDSIKIPDATPEIIQFVFDFGKEYGYSFEHQATYERMCLVNDAVYIAKYASPEYCEELYGKRYVNKDGVVGDCKKWPNKWSATGTQFAVPYVFKKLFSHENIEFNDLCETKAVKDAELYLDMNEDLPDVSEYEKELTALERKLKKEEISPDIFEEQSQALKEIIAKGHSYHFVGEVGQFCPIKPGSHGGLLMRGAKGRYSYAAGTKGWRWLESEMIRDPESSVHSWNDIDTSYYDILVDQAIKTISEFGDFEWFVSDDPYIKK